MPEYETEFFLYLDVDRSAISCFVKIRISNSILLNIEKSRHLKIPVEQRMCPLCKQEIEDEYQFIMKCQNLDELKNKFVDEIISVVPHPHRKIQFYFKAVKI